jgi:hypothetical protein
VIRPETLSQAYVKKHKPVCRCGCGHVIHAGQPVLHMSLGNEYNYYNRHLYFRDDCLRALMGPRPEQVVDITDAAQQIARVIKTLG